MYIHREIEEEKTFFLWWIFTITSQSTFWPTNTYLHESLKTIAQKSWKIEICTSFIMFSCKICCSFRHWSFQLLCISWMRNSSKRQSYGHKTSFVETTWWSFLNFSSFSLSSYLGNHEEKSKYRCIPRECVNYFNFRLFLIDAK